MPSKRLRAILTDFGVVQIVESKALLVKNFQVASLEGASTYYASPEALYQLRNDKLPPGMNALTFKSRDVYSLGVVFYECVTKKKCRQFYN